MDWLKSIMITEFMRMMAGIYFVNVEGGSVLYKALVHAGRSQ